MEKKIQYAAFLSHRSPDKKAAALLQNRIERYVIPREIRKERAQRGRTPGKVCLDSNDFATNELKNEIMEKLDASRKMILLCSPCSASPAPGNRDWSRDPSQVEDWSASPSETGWVGFEIDYMLKQGRLGDIIPVVVDGDPSDRSCFHPLIRPYTYNGELTWNNFRPEDRKDRRNLMKIIAPIIGVKDLSRLIDRDKKARRWKKAGIAALLTAALTLAAGAWYFFAPHTTHYADYVLLSGTPQGVEKLSASACAALPEHYVITRRIAAREITLRHVNAALTPVEDASGKHIDAPMIAVYKCRDNWRPDTVEYRDRNGAVLITYAFATDMQYVTFQENEYTSTQVYPAAEENEYGVPTRLKIDRYALYYNDAGQLVKRWYMSGVNYVTDEKGVSGEEYGYDEEGRLCTLRYIDRAGEHAADSSGIAGKNYYYDHSGTICRTEIVDRNGALVCGQEYYAFTVSECSRPGLPDRTVYYDADGKRCVNASGYAEAAFTYDASGQLMSVSYFGVRGEPVFCGDKYHKAVFSYNERGDLQSAAYTDENGAPVIAACGYAALQQDCDRNGNVLEIRYLGPEGQAWPGPELAAKMERKVDASGCLIEETLWDVSGEPILGTKGYFRQIVELDGRHRPLRLSYYGLDGEAVYHTDGYHELRFDYDDRGNMTRVSVYDIHGRLVPFSGSWAVQEMSYNGGGQVTRVAYADPYGNPVMTTGGYARLENEYDDRGLLISTAYYDDSGALTRDMTLNDFGVLVGSRWYAAVGYTYDERGSMVEAVYYDEQGGPVSDAGYAREVNRYDSDGRLIGTDRYDAAGKRASETYATVTYRYNERGQVTELLFSDADGRPCDNGAGYARALMEKDLRGSVTSQSCYRADGTLFGAAMTTEYDENGRAVKECYYRADGSPYERGDGYSQITCVYDSSGNKTEIDWRDASGTITNNEDGYAVERRLYDPRTGVIREWSYYGADGESVNVPAGFSRLTQSVNEWRNTTELCYYDRNGELLLRSLREYKDYAYVTRMENRDGSGAPLPDPTYGISIVEQDYDALHQKTGARFFGKDGESAVLIDCAAWSSEYEDALETRRTNYGTDGRPMNGRNGFAEVRFLYDEYGREIERRFFGEDGSPVDTVFGFSRYEIDYDRDGTLAASRFYDAAGNRLENVRGELRLVTLALGGDITYREGAGADGESIGAATQENYRHVRRIAFYSDTGDTDLMLQYYLDITPTVDTSGYLRAAKKQTIPILTGNGIDLSAYPEGAAWEETLTRYCIALESGRAEKLTDVLSMEYLELTADYIRWMTGSDTPTETILGEYREFYQQIMDDTLGSYASGGTVALSCEILGAEEASRSAIEATNAQLRSMLGTDAPVTEASVDLTVRFEVNGSEVKAEGLFNPVVTLLKVDGRWGLGTASGFPTPGGQLLLTWFS